MNRYHAWKLKRQIRRDYEEWARNGARPIILPPDRGACPMCGRAFAPGHDAGVPGSTPGGERGGESAKRPLPQTDAPMKADG